MEFSITDGIYLPLALENFNNYDQPDSTLDEAEVEEQIEMAEQEIESLTSIYNKTEIAIIPLEEAPQYFEGDIAAEIKVKKIKNIFKLSLPPKSDDLKFVFSESRMNSSVPVNSLPVIELWICLPEGYPSQQAPLFMQRTDFYIKHLPLDEFITT